MPKGMRAASSEAVRFICHRVRLLRGEERDRDCRGWETGIGKPGGKAHGGGAGVRDFARSFYSSKAWQETRRAYRKSVGGLCERCLAKGIYRAGVIVHHKVYLSPDNINDPDVSLNWNNLELVCRDCHAAEHEKIIRRYTVDDQGRISAR